ncbi:MAG: hypothetical protein KDA24_20030 [Deltaproteobacteria bacterium]|nr:hypothetical protein [Deltaproteobacteria bacterium]
MRFAPLLLASLLLPACVVDQQWEEFTLERAPFANAWVPRGQASFEVMLAEGYTCPDGLGARIYLVEPDTPADELTPRPLALLLHGRNFDVVREAGAQLSEEDRLSALWASDQVENVLGMESSLGTAGQGQGAWVAELLERGFAVVVPANCWGDMWHGTGRNAYDEGFLRLGTRLASEAVQIADARPGIAADPLVVVALSEGGRGLVELYAEGTPIDAAFVDSSPDWLSPMVAVPTAFRPEIDALLAIYDDEVGEIADPQAQLDALRIALERDSMVHAVGNLGFNAPLVWAWSSLDERIDPAWSQPAADVISTTYPAGAAQVLDWGIADHAPSNRNPTEAGERLDWLLGRLGIVLP